MALVFTTATAQAATPETPQLSVETPAHATEANLHGTLTPAAEGETGTYRFLYAVGASCEGGSETLPVPTLGVIGEEVAATLTALAPGTEYTVCLLDEVSPTEKAQSAPQSFTTAIAPEVPQALTPNPVGSTTATFHGVVNPGAPGNSGTYEFFYRQSATECEGPGGLTAGGPVTGTEGEAVENAVEGLLPNTTYSVCLRVHNEAGETAVTPALQFTTVAVAPKIVAESASNLTAETVDFEAKINPNGSATTYTFEYGPTTSYGDETPAASAGSGQTPVTVLQHITGLEKDHTYHWRLTAKSPAGTTTSLDHTFVYDTTSAGLPDGRQYEMVTPPFKNGALINAPEFEGIEPEVAENGGRVVAVALQCFGGASSCVIVRQSNGVPYEFARASSGWSAASVAPLATMFQSYTQLGFNADSGTGLMVVPTAHGEDFVGRTAGGEFVHIGPTFESPGSFGRIEKGSELATANLSHLLYETEGPEWPSFDPTNPNGITAYEYDGVGNRVPRLVGIAPASSELVSKCGTSIGNVTDPFSNFHAISVDGETVYFNARTCLSGENGVRPEVPANTLYVRYEHARSELVSTPSPGVCETTGCRDAAPGDAEYIAASSDGSRVFFTDTQRLTDSASEDSHEGDSAKNCPSTTEGLSGCNLYESECPNRCESPAARTLIDVSASDAPGGPRVQGILGSASDGSHIYFVALGALTSTPNSQGREPEEGQPNLYSYERDTGTPAGHLSYIATLSPEDEPEWHPGEAANVTPDGRFLVFTSHIGLTDDARQEGPLQVYRYDSQTATLVRVSIGAKGFNDNGNLGVGDAAIARANVSTNRLVGSARPDPTMSNDGRFVFFSSPIGLTPQALNDVPAGVGGALAQNIYEWHDGEVALISDGKDTSTENKDTPAAVQLTGSDASGANVVFSTNDSLVKQDSDSQRDFYDAHICSAGFYEERGIEPQSCPSEPQAAIACGEASCQTPSPATPPGPAPPASQSLSGAGNLMPAPVLSTKPHALTRAQQLTKALRACKRDRSRKRRTACEKQARRRYSAKKTNTGGRAR